MAAPQRRHHRTRRRGRRLRGRGLPDRHRAAHSRVSRSDLAPPHGRGRDRRPRRTARHRARRLRRAGVRCAVRFVEPPHRPSRHPRPPRRAGVDHPHPLDECGSARARTRSHPLRPLLVGDARPRSSEPGGVPGRGPGGDRRDRRRRGRKGRARPRSHRHGAGERRSAPPRARALDRLPRHVDLRRRRIDRCESRDARDGLGRQRHGAGARRDLPARGRRRRRRRSILRPRAQPEGHRRAPVRRAERARFARPPHALAARRRRAVHAGASEPLAPRDGCGGRARGPRLGARPGRIAAPHGGGGRHSDGCRDRADQAARAVRPRPLRRPGRLGGRERRRRMGDRTALRPDRRRADSATGRPRPPTRSPSSRMPEPGSSQGAIPRPSCSRRA